MFMSSGHWTNTGMAKFINDNLYNYKSDDEKSMNPFRWYRFQNGDDVSKYRETINGFPCRLILINDGSTPLNEGQNEPTPGNTKDMGIFNFNHDKDATKTLGFDSDIFPSCASYEVTANSDTSAGAFISAENGLRPNLFSKGQFVYGTYTDDLTKGVSVKMLNDNSFEVATSSDRRYFAGAVLSVPTEINKEYTLKAICNVSYGAIYMCLGTGKPNTGGWLKTVNTDTELGFTFTATADITDIFFYALENQITENNGYGLVTYKNVKIQETKEISEAEELAYLKESFELRHPDADDVAEDWGFMGVEEEVKILTIDYFIENGSRRTSQILTDNLNGSITVTSIIGTRYAVYMYFYDMDGKYLTNIYDFTGVTQSIPDGAYYASISIKEEHTEVIINGVTYAIGDDLTGGVLNKEPYDKMVIQKAEGTGLKALIDWVDNCTDEEFVNDFEQHFHKDYTLRYYCLVVLIGAVDNLGKNMMLDTADNKIFFPRFYDIDTICSYDNSGQLKFDVDIEMEQGYWNTSSSRLWTRIRDLMHADIVATYNNMRQNGVSYENMMHYIYDEQIAKIPQTYYNKDYDVKYAPFADSYIGMAHGDTYEHVKRWLKQRFTFVDTLFDYAPSYNNDVLTIRANTTELMTLEIETYTPVYQHLSWYNGQMDKKKIDGKVSVEFSGTAQAATDQEVLIYGGSNVKSIKGITSMNPNRMLIGSATRLVELDAHDCPLLNDINANKANLSPHEYLNKVNLSNCPLLEGNLRLNNSPLVQEINIKGTNITGLNLPSSIRNLQVLRLPNTMTDLTLNDASMLHTLDFDEGINLQSVSMTNCNALENVTGLDLLQTPSITLNNSYNTVAELYFRDTTNLSLINMSNLERVIFTPNNEYETFELINIANAPDYKVTTFNCPKLSTFMTTAPYRESYNNCGMRTISEPTGTLVYKDYSSNGTTFSKVVPFDYYNDVIEAEIDLTNCDAGHTNENILSFAIDEDRLSLWGQNLAIHIYYTPSSKTLKFSYCGNTYNIDKIITDTIVNIKMDKGTIYLNNEVVLEGSIIESVFSPITTIAIGSKEGSTRSTALYKLVGVNYGEIDREVKDYGNIQPDTTFTANSIDISSTQFTDVKLLCTTDTNTLKLPTTVKNFYCDSSFDLDTNHLEDGEYDVVHGELVEPYTTDYEGEVVRIQNVAMTLLTAEGNLGENIIDNEQIASTGALAAHNSWVRTDYIPCYPNTPLSVKCNDMTNGIRVSFYAEDKSLIAYNSTLNGRNSIASPLNTSYVIVSIRKDQGNAKPSELSLSKPFIPNLIPSSADGSLIFSMYAPSKTVAPTSGTWDLKGLKFDNFHTFGMNNDVKPSEDSYVKISKTNFRYNKGYTWGVISSNFATLYDSSHGSFNKNVIGVLDGISLDIGDTLKIINFIANGEVNNTYGVNMYRMRADCTHYNVGTSGYIVSIKNNPSVVASSEPLHVYFALYTADLNNTPITELTDIIIEVEITKSTGEVITNKIQLVNTEEYPSWPVNNTDIMDSIITRYESEEFLQSITLYKGASSITMPTRYDDYNITIKNADISPKTHNTMLYPLLVNEDNPITGTLDYTNYAGKHLSWSFAYTDEEYVDIIQPKNELLNSYEYRYNAFYDTEYEFDNPYEIARYTSNASGVLPGFNAEFTYTYDEKNNGDGTYTVSIATDSLDNLPTAISFNGISNSIYRTTILTIEKLNTSQVTNMDSMFRCCRALTSVRTDCFDTSKVTNMSAMFRECSNLTSLDLSGFDTSLVQNMGYMFQDSTNLTELDVSGFDTGDVIDMTSMFSGCRSLTSLDVSGFDTSNVTGMNNMFYGCSSLTSLDVSGFDTSNVTGMNNMFYGCSSLTSLDVSGFVTSKVTNMQNMFHSCSGLTSLNVSEWDTSNVTNMNYMFNGCSGLTSLDVSGFVTSEVAGMIGVFQNCSGLTSLNVSEWDTSNVTNMNSIFNNCEKLTSLDLSNFDTSKVVNMTNLVRGCKALTELVGLSDWDTSALIDMSYAFQSLPLTNLDLGGWDLTNCTNATTAWNFMYNLNSIVFPNNLSVSFGIAQSSNLTADNVVEIFNKLATVTTTQTATIGANLLAKLTEDQIAIATNKGWTVA